jgi:hypothetical protein
MTHTHYLSLIPLLKIRENIGNDDPATKGTLVNKGFYGSTQKGVEAKML